MKITKNIIEQWIKKLKMHDFINHKKPSNHYQIIKYNAYYIKFNK